MDSPLLGLLAVGLALGPQIAQSVLREAKLLPLDIEVRIKLFTYFSRKQTPSTTSECA